MDWIRHGETTCGIHNQTLKVNQACLDVISNFNETLRFYVKNTECFECDYTLQGKVVHPNSKTSFIIDTDFGLESYFSDGKNKFCPMTNYFEDFGVYQMNISENDCGNVMVMKKPEDFWINVGFLTCLYFGLFIGLWLIKFLYVHCHLHLSATQVSFSELEMDLGTPDREERKLRLRRQTRMKSIDAFRGLAIALMIFVNYGGGDYYAFKHSPWNGLSIADLVFPWFVWIMGASIVFSLKSSLRMSVPKKKIFLGILKRSVILIALGLILNSGKRDKNFLRVCGVLQRLGVTYFFVAVIELIVAKPQRNEQYGPWFYFQDIVDSWVQWILVICFAVAHELLTFMLEVPGCPKGYLGPGGFSEHSLYKNCTGGVAGYIDRLIITENHMYHHGTFVKIYKPPVAYDPEGLLGLLTSIFCAFLGVHAGRIILSFENPYSRIRQWLLWAVVTGISAGFLCSWSQNYGIIPVNKNLWSLSYVLACSSLAFLILAVFYWLIDFNFFWSGSPFVYAGMNSIVLYIGHSLLKQQLPWRWFPYTSTHLEILIMDVTATIVWIFISYILFRKNVFISV